MGTRTLNIPYPEDLPASMGTTPEALEQELRFLVAAKLYELGRLSSAQAAELAGVPRVIFLEQLGHYQISAFNTPRDEIAREIHEARNRAASDS